MNSRPTLIRAIGRWALTAAVINSVIGSGVFGLPSTLAGFAGAWSPVTVLVAGVGIFIIVLCFAEVGSRFDEPGGPYLYTREAFGPAFGFQIGWLHIWTRLLSGAAVLNVLSGYLAPLVPWAGTATGRASVMIFAVTLVTVIKASRESCGLGGIPRPVRTVIGAERGDTAPVVVTASTSNV